MGKEKKANGVALEILMYKSIRVYRKRDRERELHIILHLVVMALLYLPPTGSSVIIHNKKNRLECV